MFLWPSGSDKRVMNPQVLGSSICIGYFNFEFYIKSLLTFILKMLNRCQILFCSKDLPCFKDLPNNKSYALLHFVTKTMPKHLFYTGQKQLPPMSILTGTSIHGLAKLLVPFFRSISAILLTKNVKNLQRRCSFCIV